MIFYGPASPDAPSRRSSTISGDTNGQTDTTIFRIRTSQLRRLALRGVRPPASHKTRPSASIWRASPAVYALRANFRGLRPRPTSEVKTEVTLLLQLFAGNNFTFLGRGAIAPPKASNLRLKSFFGLLTALAAFGNRQKISVQLTRPGSTLIFYGPASPDAPPRRSSTISGDTNGQTDTTIFRIRTSQLRCLALRGVRPPASHWSRPSASIWRASPAVYALRANFRGLRPRPTSEVKTEVTFLLQLFAGNTFTFIGRGAIAPPKASNLRLKSFFGLLTALAAFGCRQKISVQLTRPGSTLIFYGPASPDAPPRRSSTISGDTNGQTDTTIFRIRTSQLRCLALRGVRPPASH